MANIKKLIADLLQKADSVSAGYEKALEDKQQAIMELQQEIQMQELKTKDYHKMALLQEVEESVYQEQQEIMKAMKDKLSSIQQEISLIEKYKTEDTAEIVAKAKAEKPALNKKKTEAIEKAKQELTKAKAEYLVKVGEISTNYKAETAVSHSLTNFLIDAGLRNEIPNAPIVDVLDPEVYTVSAYEVSQAYN